LILEIKNFGQLEIQNLVLDMNGTIACDGKLIPGILDRINTLKHSLKIFLISADTFGTANEIANYLGISLFKLNPSQIESDQKEAFVESLNAKNTIAFGNGRNDIKMLKKARIGIGIIGSEGMAAEVLANATIIVSSPLDAFDLLLYPKRLLATLRD